MSARLQHCQKGAIRIATYTSKIHRLIPIQQLKMTLKAQQSLFTKPTKRAKAATEASFSVNYLLTKHKSPFTDGEFLKEVMTVIADALFIDFKNKEDTKTAINSVLLGPAMLIKRVELLSEDMSDQILKDLQIFSKWHTCLTPEQLHYCMSVLGSRC